MIFYLGKCLKYLGLKVAGLRKMFGDVARGFQNSGADWLLLHETQPIKTNLALAGNFVHKTYFSSLISNYFIDLIEIK